jgi:hypothetical protein
MMVGLSRHAISRARQRGITEAQLSALAQYADKSVRRGSGTELIWISVRALASMGPRTPEGVDVDRLGKLRLLIANDETGVTTYRVSK